MAARARSSQKKAKTSRTSKQERQRQAELEEEAAQQAQLEYEKRRQKMFQRAQELQWLLRSIYRNPVFVYDAASASFRGPEDGEVVQCPACNRHMTNEEVIAGFSSDPLEIRTVCPQCKMPFTCSAVIATDFHADRFLWLCPAQTREAYKHWLTCLHYVHDFASLCREFPHIAWNALRYGLRDRDLASVDAEQVIWEFLKSDE